MKFFTSDHHFSHKSILDFEDRPFTSLEEMDRELVKIWNQTVSEHDTVYYLGDFALTNQERTLEIVSQLNGEIIFIRGNHDHENKVKRMLREGYIKEYHDIGLYIKHNKNRLYLSHFPMEIGNRPRMFNLHGHIHSQDSQFINQINVGVDSPMFKYKPFGELISLDEIDEFILRANKHLELLKQKEREE